MLVNIMIHKNQEWRNIKGGSLLNLLAVQEYEALSVRDFIENKREVQPTRSFLPPAVGYWNRAGITFHNVNFRKGDNGLPHQLYDMTGTIDVMFHHFYGNDIHSYDSKLEPAFSSDFREPKFDEGRLYEAWVLYKPSTDEAILAGVKPLGPPTPEVGEDEDISFKLRPEY